MEEGWLPGILHVIYCPLGNGLLPYTPRPVLPPQATWRSGDGYPWTKKEKRKIYGRRPMPAAYNAWWKHPPDVPGKQKAREWSHKSALLVQAFLTTTGRRVSPSSLRECWPSRNDIIPRKPIDIVRARITHCLDNVAMRSPSTITWDMFTCPESNKSFWKEDCLPYSPGSTVDLSTRMPGMRLKLHDREGNYQGVARVLKYEGHMLVYDPQTNGAGWVAMKGVPSLLTEVEVRSAEDLGNFYPVPCGTREDPQNHPVTPRRNYCRIWTAES